MRWILAAALLAAACSSNPPPRDPVTPPDGTGTVPASAPRDQILAFFDERPVTVTEVGRYLIDQDSFSTVQRYIAHLLLTDLREQSGLRNEPTELESRARWEVVRGREMYGAEWPAFLRSAGATTEDEFIAQLASSSRLNEMLLNEKMFYRDVCRSGYSLCRIEFLETGSDTPSEVIEEMILAQTTPPPFLRLEDHLELLLAEEGATLELTPAIGAGRCRVHVMRKQAPYEAAPAELTRMVAERPPDTHELGLWIAFHLQQAVEEGRIRHATGSPEGD